MECHCVTVVSATNSMPVNKNPSYHLTSDRIRRLAWVPIVSERHGKDLNMVPCDSDGINQLAYISMAVRIKYDKPPMTVRCLLMTLFLARYDEALEVVIFCPKLEASKDYLN
jgi:hypothetical protein